MEVLWNFEEGRVGDGSDLHGVVEREIKDVTSWSSSAAIHIANR